MDYQSIIDKYYPSENELRRILLVHSRQVADRSLKIAKDWRRTHATGRVGAPCTGV